MKLINLKTALLAAALILLGGYVGWRNFYDRLPPEPAVAHLLSQSMPDAKGKSQTLSQWKENALLVNFWATWCVPCIEEMPELSALQAEVATRNIRFIGIGVDSAVNIVEFASKYAINYPLYVAGMTGSELSRRFGNDAGVLPFTVLIGRDGHVKKTYIGRLNMGQMRTDLAAL